MEGALAPRHEDDIALARIGVIVLEKEELVDAVLLQGRDLDDVADRAGQTALDDQVLLAPNLYMKSNSHR